MLSGPAGDRPGPRALLFTHRWQISLLILFIPGAVAVLLGVNGSHSIAVLTAFSCFLIFSILDVIYADTLQRTLPRIGYVLWNFSGMLGPVVVYLWLLRNLDSTGPLALWPLLCFPLYFLIRLYQHRGFFPLIVVPVIMLAVIAFVAPFVLAPTSVSNSNLSAALWLTITLLVYLVHVRTWDARKIRYDAYRDIVKWRGYQEAQLEEIQRLVKDLGSRLNMELLTVLEIFRPNVDSDLRQQNVEMMQISDGADPKAIRPPHYVRIVAKYPDEIVVQPWPLNRGLLHEAFKKREPIICLDNNQLPCKGIYYNPPDAKIFDGTRSELVVPIIDGPDGEIIGFVDLQSKTARGIEEEDKDLLAALAAEISPFMVKRRLRTFLTALEKLRASLERAWYEEDAFDQIARFAQRVLDVDVVTYYKLGYGNGWPKPRPMQLGAWFPNRLEDEAFHRDNPPPVLLVSRWEVLPEQNSKNNVDLLPSGWAGLSEKDFFILREQIESTVFLPVGTKKRRLGALFLNYRVQKTFSDTDKLMFNTFLQTIIPFFDGARRHSDTQEGFENEIFILHDLIGRSGRAGQSLDSKLTSLKQNKVLGNEIDFSKMLDELREDVNKLTRETNSASIKTSVDVRDHLHQGLVEAFSVATGQLAHAYGVGFAWQLNPPQIGTAFPFEFRLAVFSIVVEAAHNAIREGHANIVNVTLAQDTKFLSIVITNDGLTWDPLQPGSRYSEYGIKSKLKIARETMFATSEWDDTGNKLTVQIPLLPFLSGKDPYE